jgi:DNA-binding IclR family transcriptional regulator
MAVMSVLCGKAEHDKGYIDMTLKMKEIILEELEMTSTHFNNITSKLAKKGFISKDKGRYHINPKYFWKGSLKARREKINDELELSIKFKIED